MEDASHLLQYRRFFGIIFSVLPGLELTYALAGVTMYVLGDVAGLDFGVSIGLSAIVFVLTFVGWLFAGTAIQKWTEDKPGMFLFGISSPFLLIFFGVMGWLFWAYVINAKAVGSAEHSELLRACLTTLG
jgi:hypothetical protein